MVYINAAIELVALALVLACIYVWGVLIHDRVERERLGVCARACSQAGPLVLGKAPTAPSSRRQD